MNKLMQACQQRRDEFLKKLPPKSIAILVGAREIERNHDNCFPFRQRSNFYYLTGLEEANAIAVLSNHPELAPFSLFVEEDSQQHAIWVGSKVGLAGAREQYHADQAYFNYEIEDVLPEFLMHCDNYCYSLGIDHKFDHVFSRAINKVRAKLRAGYNLAHTIMPLDVILNQQRLYKDPLEIQAMRDAAKISSEAHLLAMQKVKRCEYEYQVHAHIMQHFMMHNMVEAYPSIVGAGANSCVLHYTRNDARLNAHDLLLIDAGAENHNYAADITRTFPISGTFSKEQLAIYDLVLHAQQAGIDSIKIGAAWHVVQDKIVEVITQGLLDLKILTGSHQELIAQQAYQQFYMHKSGHHLGLDVHDPGPYTIDSKAIAFANGMALTVEPGIYITPHDNVDKKWWNIGVRIEDDILIYNNKVELLSSAPKEASEIEQIINE